LAAVHVQRSSAGRTRMPSSAATSTSPHQTSFPQQTRAQLLPLHRQHGSRRICRSSTPQYRYVHSLGSIARSTFSFSTIADVLMFPRAAQHQARATIRKEKLHAHRSILLQLRLSLARRHRIRRQILERINTMSLPRTAGRAGRRPRPVPNG
jgi:hypothetical protein